MMQTIRKSTIFMDGADHPQMVRSMVLGCQRWVWVGLDGLRQVN